LPPASHWFSLPGARARSRLLPPRDQALPSWNDSAAKSAIVDFVGRVTAQGMSDFVPPAERIARLTTMARLWTEQPVYFQLAFAFDRIKAMAPQHPEWKAKQPFKALLEKDIKALAASGERVCCKSWPRPMPA